MVRPAGHVPKIVALAIAGIAFALLGEANSDSPETTGKTQSWRAGRPVAIQVERGSASFDIPCPEPGSRTLVIVSALARPTGPYPIKLTAKATESLRPIVQNEANDDRRAEFSTNRSAVPAPTSSHSPPERRTFHLIAQGGDVASASSYLAVDGRLQAVGQRIQVYVDGRDLGQVEEATLRDLVTTFDQQIYPTGRWPVWSGDRRRSRRPVHSAFFKLVE